MNISHSVTPNIQVSLAWEKVRVFRLSGAHLAEAGVKQKASQSTPTHIGPKGHKCSFNKHTVAPGARLNSSRTRDTVGRADVSTRSYTDLEKTTNAQVFDPHAACSRKRVKLPGRGSRERKKVRGSRRAEERGIELRLSSN